MPGFLWDGGAPLDVRLIIFGSGGTLLDFDATYLVALRECAEAIAVAAGEPALAPALLKAGGWQETDKGPIAAPGSIMRRGTNHELAQLWIDSQPMVAARWQQDAAALRAEMHEALLRTTARDATALGSARKALDEFRAAGIHLAVVTNDDEALARAQFRALGWDEETFVRVVGADSGHGQKPKAGGLRAAMATAGAKPLQTIVVGDAEADVEAARTAGCLFSVVLFPDGQHLPASLAGAAVRAPSVYALPQILADGGCAALRRRHGRVGAGLALGDDEPADGAPVRQLDPAALLDPVRARQLEPSLDAELLALVHAMRPADEEGAALVASDDPNVDPVAEAIAGLMLNEERP